MNPVLLGEAVRQVVLCLLLFEVIHWNEAQMLGFLSAFSAIVSLLVRGTTVSTAVVSQRVDERVAHREMVGTTGTGEGMTPDTSRTGESTPSLR
jgi:hypothetical protein